MATDFVNIEVPLTINNYYNAQRLSNNFTSPGYRPQSFFKFIDLCCNRPVCIQDNSAVVDLSLKIPPPDANFPSAHIFAKKGVRPFWKRPVSNIFSDVNWLPFDADTRQLKLVHDVPEPRKLKKLKEEQREQEENKDSDETQYLASSVISAIKISSKMKLPSGMTREKLTRLVNSPEYLALFANTPNQSEPEHHNPSIDGEKESLSRFSKKNKSSNKTKIVHNEDEPDVNIAYRRCHESKDDDDDPNIVDISSVSRTTHAENKHDESNDDENKYDEDEIDGDTVNITRRIQIYLTDEQRAIFNIFFGTSRFFYNRAVDRIYELIDERNPLFKENRDKGLCTYQTNFAFPKKEETKNQDSKESKDNNTNSNNANSDDNSDSDDNGNSDDGKESRNDNVPIMCMNKRKHDKYFCEEHKKYTNRWRAYDMPNEISFFRHRDQCIGKDCELPVCDDWQTLTPRDTRGEIIKDAVSAYNSMRTNVLNGHVKPYSRIGYRTKKGNNQSFIVGNKAFSFSFDPENPDDDGLTIFSGHRVFKIGTIKIDERAAKWLRKTDPTNNYCNSRIIRYKDGRYYFLCTMNVKIVNFMRSFRITSLDPGEVIPFSGFVPEGILYELGKHFVRTQLMKFALKLDKLDSKIDLYKNALVIAKETGDNRILDSLIMLSRLGKQKEIIKKREAQIHSAAKKWKEEMKEKRNEDDFDTDEYNEEVEERHKKNKKWKEDDRLEKKKDDIAKKKQDKLDKKEREKRKKEIIEDKRKKDEKNAANRKRKAARRKARKEREENDGGSESSDGGSGSSDSGSESSDGATTDDLASTDEEDIKRQKKEATKKLTKKKAAANKARKERNEKTKKDEKKKIERDKTRWKRKRRRSIRNIIKKKIRNMRRRQALLRTKIRRRVDDFHWKAISFLCSNFDIIVIPRFEVKDMTRKTETGWRAINGETTRRMLMLGHGKFRTRLMQTARRRGNKVIIVDEAYTSKTCGQCGNTKTREEMKEMEGRMYKCTICGMKLGRDENGARNILLRLLTEYGMFASILESASE